MINQTNSNDEFNINDLDVFFLDGRAQIYDACALLYKTCIDVTHPWKFDSDNPSNIHVESRNGKHVLVDRFTDTADWLGVFHNDKLVACGRLIAPEKSPTGKLECESYPGARIVDFPREARIEMNRVSVLREYQGSKIHHLIYLAAFEYCRLQRKFWVGCTSHPSVKKLFQKINLKPLLAKAFKYAETDPEPVDVFCADPVKLKWLCRNLRETLASELNILDALEMVAPVVPTPLYWHDIEGRVLGLNDATLEIMGAPDRATIIGKSPFDFYPEDTATMIWSHSAEVIRSGQVLCQDEPINQFATGEYVYAKAIKAPLRDGNGNVIGIIGTSVDITSEKLAGQLKILTESQRITIEEKEKYVAIARKVAHDVASPLTTLSILANAFKRVPDEQKKMFNAALERLSTITNDLLTTYRLVENGHSIGNENEIRQIVCVYEHIALITEEKKIQWPSIKFEFSASTIARSAIARLQVNQFQRALCNLLTNAIEALEDRSGTIKISLEATKSEIRVGVYDDGTGMPEHVRQAILNGQQISDGKTNGNGLGMQQVWDMLNQNDGAIQIHSEPAQGTAITLTFPRS